MIDLFIDLLIARRTQCWHSNSFTRWCCAKRTEPNHWSSCNQYYI